MRTAGGEGAPSVADRVFTVLEVCAESTRPLSLVDLVERTGLPKTTLHRICWKLVELGMLDRRTDGFSIGTRIFAMGAMNPELRRLRATSMPYLHTLAGASGHATNLAVLAKDRALVLEEVFGRGAASMPRMVGAGLPLHATAIGKALLAGFAEDEFEDWLATTGLRPYTGATTVRPNLLREQLERVRERGVAVSHEEYSPGTSGVAAPVRVEDRVVAAVAIVGPLNSRTLLKMEGAVLQAATGIGRALTPRPVAVAA